MVRVENLMWFGFGVGSCVCELFDFGWGFVWFEMWRYGHEDDGKMGKCGR